MISEKTIRKQIRFYNGNTYSQMAQDVLVLVLTNFLKNGYFVEFGATDGISLSNTVLLEREYGWSGICAEPIPFQFEKLKQNRKCSVDHRVVYNTTGEQIKFKINQESLDESGIVDKDDKDAFDVESVTLVDLLRQYNAPKHINYLSIDTEGTEFSIIENFDFYNYTIDIITIEHNYVEENRKKIYSHLIPLGYKRILTDKSRWDDWYVKTTLLENFDESIYYPSEE
jgi:FkbM family methyltransferase